jgi:multiple sugar transport system permease protein
MSGTLAVSGLPAAANTSRGTFEDRARGWQLIAPAMVVLCLMNVVPILWSIGMGFFRYRADRLRTPPHFLGLANYANLLTDDDIWERVTNTGEMILGSLVLQIAVGATLTWLFYRPFAGRRLILMLVLAPMLLSTVFVGTFFNFFILPPFGLVPMLLAWLLGHPVNPLASPAGALASLVVADAWMWSPFVMLMLMAGLGSVPKELCEAAEIDRASRWHRFRTVIFPSVRGVLLLAVLFRIIESFNAYDLIFTITNGGPGTSTETLSTEIYGDAFVLFETGRASALANFSTFVIIVLVNLYFQAIRERNRSADAGGT